jgi:hypothetical protein
MKTVLADARRGHPGLFWFAAASGALAVVLLGLAVLDQRTLLGAPLWFKPAKFAISFVLYGGALAWMLGQLPRPRLRRTGWVIVGASVIEMVIIVGQAARGVRSHFNDDDALGIALFGIMGATILVLYLATVAIALRFLREPGRDPVMGLAIRLGLLVGLVGLATGFVMAALGGHAVGVADGGPGLPLLGWSTEGGDLRVSHFIGMHALQALPLLAALTAARSLDVTGRRRIVFGVAAGYLGVVLLTMWQALRAQPLLAPDGLTLGTLAVIAAGTVAVAVGARTSVPRDGTPLTPGRREVRSNAR